MKTFGFTGGIGMGKSTATELLRRWEVPVVDTDELARGVVEPGQPALAEVQSVFGPSIIGDDGRLRRDQLARRVFKNAAARTRLEAILHPRIRALWQAQVAAWRASGVVLGVVVIPLLFETDSAAAFDATVCVACSSGMQRERLQGRGWSEAERDQRIAAQWPTAKKMSAADFVIWTEGSLDVLEEQLRRVIR